MLPLVRSLVDTAGGIILSNQTLVRADGVPVVTVGAPVSSHGSGSHSAATMVAGSLFVRVEGLPVCFLGSPASCGHTATGSSHVSVSE